MHILKFSIKLKNMDYNNIMNLAEKASKNSYSIYSNFAVGACVLTESERTYVGTNVENSSYGLTICAERNAIANAIVNGEKSIKAIAIYSPNRDDCKPCGACRQVIYEFQKNNEIDIITKQGDSIKVYKINNLLPDGFILD